MNYIENLDYFLKYISEKDDFTYSLDIYLELKELYSKKELTLAVEKLLLDSYIDLKIDETEITSKINPRYYCRINYHGLRFLERGGYESENKRIRLSTRDIKARTIANALNACIIIIIAIISGIYVPYYLNKKDETIKEKDKKIEMLSAKVDSLTTIQEGKQKYD